MGGYDFDGCMVESPHPPLAHVKSVKLWKNGMFCTVFVSIEVFEGLAREGLNGQWEEGPSSVFTHPRIDHHKNPPPT